MKISRAIPLILLVGTGVLAAHRALRWPVDLAPSITGTFGEQRGQYFHSGIDVKTEGRTGHSVYAVDEGYLHSATARDKGYGNSLIINHGNILSQYAHLDSFVEGSIGLNTMMEVIKILYENDVEDFIFRKTKIFFKKCDLIAKSGETGSGPPHLHFALRESGGVINPLEYLHVPDTEAPVIRAITFCVEKNSSTVHSETVAVNKTWRGYIPEKKVFQAREGDRCFIKLSCFDRVASRNRCAVYRISLLEDGTPIYEIDFPRYRWPDSAMAKYIFDSSMPAFAGESLYTYFLCKREGNAFSRIVAKDNGYIAPKDKRRNFTIQVSDYAGNETSVEFSLEKYRENSRDYSEGFIKVPSPKSATLSDSSGKFFLFLPKGILFRDALMKIASAPENKTIKKLISAGIIKKEDASQTYAVHPFDQMYHAPARTSIQRPDFISKDEAENIIIYHSFEGTAPSGLITKYNKIKDSFEAETRANGYFFLLRDRRPPLILLPPFQDCIVDTGPYRILRLYFADELSGINSKSIRVYIDGMKYPATFDYDRSWAEVKLPGKAISRGVHHLFVRVKDRANNEAFARSLLAF